MVINKQVSPIKLNAQEFQTADVVARRALPLTLLKLSKASFN
jgi:hypothetical protein